MKKSLLFFGFILCFNSIFSQSDNVELKNPPPRYTMFSFEMAHAYNGINAKHGVQAKFYMWSDKLNNFGFETHAYLPRKNSNNVEIQLDLNYRKILVDFHPLFFDVLVGPGFRYYKPDNYEWIFDGINIGFGIGYRYKNFSYYMMPRITHSNSEVQVTTGIKYHFNYDTRRIFNKRYKLKTKRVN